MDEALRLPISTADLDSLDDLPTKRPNSLLSGALWSVLGLGAGFTVIFFDYYFSGDWGLPISKTFLSSTAGQFWLFLIVVQTVYWAAVVRPMYTSLVALKRYYKSDATAIVLWCGLLALLIFMARQFAPTCGLNPKALKEHLPGSYGLPNSGTKLFMHTIIGTAVALMAGAGSLLVRVGFKNLLPSADSSIQKIRRFLSLRNCLLHFLTIAGIMLGLVTLAQTAKRSAVMGSSPVTGAVCNPYFGQDRVLLYGLYYTVIIVIAFAPTFSAMFNASRKLGDDILPMPSPDDDSWAMWYKRRQQLQQLLEFNSTQGVRVGMTVIAPLLGSALTLFTPR